MHSFNFNDSEIKDVCNDLGIPESAFSDDERKSIIECWKNANIVACPGSGKTTVLLAKLLLLAKRMPFEDGSGICVLTHTNVGVDEIKSKLGSKADILFKHPNHFGTIQSFVDKYFAKSSYKKKFKQNIKMIDGDIVNRIKTSKYYSIPFCKKGEPKTLRNFLYNKSNIGREKLNSKQKDSNGSEYFCSLKFDLIDNKIKSSNGKVVLAKVDNENYKSIKSILFDLWERGILSFSDSYNFTNNYLYNEKYSKILKTLISNRFKFLFIDEMQDTQAHQMDIFDKVFNNDVTKQHYGDPDQAIFNGIGGEEMAWDIKKLTKEGYEKKEITSSKRFGTKISHCIYPFRKEISKVNGNSEVKSFKPYLILYENPKKAIEKFTDIIKANKLTEIDIYENWKKESAPFNAVGFVGKKTKNCETKTTLHSYVDNFSKETAKKRMNFPSLISYFQKRPTEEINENGTQIYFNLFMNAFLALLDQGNVKYEGRCFNKNSLKSYMSEEYSDILNKFTIKIYQWIIDIEEEKKDSVLIKKEFTAFFKTEIQKVCFHNFKDSAYKSKFMTIDIIENIEKFVSNGNIKDINGIQIKIGTIHSVKGETHLATLLLETDNYQESESSYFLNDKKEKNQLFCSNIEKLNDNATRINGRLKSVYVALSRPTHLLCVALDKSKVKCLNFGGNGKKCPKYNSNECNWKIENI